MDAVKGFRPELLLFAAFFATIPFFSPNYTVFHAVSELSDAAVGPFAQTVLVAGAVAGIAVVVAAARGKARVLGRRPVMTAAAVLYVAGYGVLCAGLLTAVPLALVIAAAVATAAGGVVLCVAWGALMARFGLRQAIFWVGITTAGGAFVVLILSSVGPAVALLAFAVLLVAGVSVPVWAAWRGGLAAPDGGDGFPVVAQAAASAFDASEAKGQGHGEGAAEGAGGADASGAAAASVAAALDGRAAAASGPRASSGAAAAFGPRAAASSGAAGEPPASPDSIDSLARRQGESLIRLFGRMGTVLFVPFAGLLVFAFITGVRKFMLFDVVYMEDLGIVLGAMAAIPLSLVKTRRPLLPFVYQVVLPLFALVLVVLNSFPQSTPPLWLAAWVSYGFFGLIAILALASLCAMAHAGEFPVALIYGATVAGFCLVSLLGMFCGTLPPFAEQNGGPALLVVSTLYFAFLIAMALSAGWQVQERAAEEAPAAEGERGDFAARCRQQAESCGLSPREGEIFAYLARGHTPAFIAKTLVISESTVRTHAKNIYRKLGVSSREQLMQLVDR